MLNTIKQFVARDEEEGFTLIELMVVVLIIAILLAIAIPTFLGARNTANARGAQSDLRNALTAEQTAWTNTQAFSTDTTTAGMGGIEPNLTWTTSAPGSSSNSNAVAVFTSSDNNILVLEAYGKDGNCYIQEQTNEANATGSTTGYAIEKTACSAPTTVAWVAPTQGNAAPTGTVFPTAFNTAW